MTIEKLIEILQKLPKDTICVDCETGIFEVRAPSDMYLQEYEGCAFSSIRIICPSLKVRDDSVMAVRRLRPGE
jgi:hypothetical protein